MLSAVARAVRTVGAMVAQSRRDSMKPGPSGARRVIEHLPSVPAGTLLRSAQHARLRTMIVSIRHKGLARFHESGSLAGIQAQHARRLRTQLAALETASTIKDMDIPGFRLHPLFGDQAGRWSIWVNANWRLTFAFREGDAYLLDYEDYH